MVVQGWLEDDKEGTVTYQQMCEVIVEDWNKEGKTKLTWEQVWDHHLVKEFPALYVPMLYDAAKTGNLVGLLLSDPACAKIFCKIVGC